MSLELQPITFREAAEFVRRHHRHHPPQHGWKFGVAVNDGEKVVGVIMVGQPVSRHQMDGWTAEVHRCCTDGTKNVCSMLYGAAWRPAKALGYKRLITYTLASEPGNSLRASGWQVVHTTKGNSKGWSVPSRPREVKAPTGPKTLWEAV